MCGIIGTINLPLSIEHTGLIRHRGPDDGGLEHFNSGQHKISFGHKRLSIVDLSPAGHQPMQTADKEYAIIFNGEIYNHLSIRKQLASNIAFKGHSDTETVLYWLAEKGPDGLKALNGIFALAFLDLHQKKLILARDPFGVKPLYLHEKDQTLVFCSELKGVLPFLSKKEPDLSNLYTFLRLRFNPSPGTLIKGVEKLKPGFYREYDLERELKFKERFYAYKPVVNHKISKKSAMQTLPGLLNSAVERQLMADVPIAMMLSGGVDSALLALLALRASGKPLPSYTIGFEGNSAVNELQDARETASILGSEHHELILSEQDFISFTSRLADIVEEPVGSQSLFAFYFLTEKIHRDGFKVALSGQGIDEAWAGYKRYNLQNLLGTIGGSHFVPLRGISGFLKNDKTRRGINALSAGNAILRHLESYSFFDESMVQKLCKHEFSNQEKKEVETLLKLHASIMANNRFSPLEKMMTLDLRTALSDDLLLYTDKISMFHSLEVRVPFLDLELMEFTEAIPGGLKAGIKGNKILYKELAASLLPEKIIRRPKKGFYIPRNEWYKGKAGKEFRNMIESDKSLFSAYFSKPFVLSLFDRHARGEKNFEDQIYSILNLYFFFCRNFGL